MFIKPDTKFSVGATTVNKIDIIPALKELMVSELQLPHLYNGYKYLPHEVRIR